MHGDEVVHDNGFNAGMDFKSTSHLDLEFDYSRNIPLLNIFIFGVAVDSCIPQYVNHRLAKNSRFSTIGSPTHQLW